MESPHRNVRNSLAVHQKQKSSEILFNAQDYTGEGSKDLQASGS